MRTDHLRNELDAIAGNEPAVDDAWQAVKARVRRRRRVTGVGVLAVSVLVIGGAVVAAQHVVEPRARDRPESAGRTGGQGCRIPRGHATRRSLRCRGVVTADGKTFAVGASDGKPLIAEIEDGRVVTSVDPTADYEPPVHAGAVNDLVAVPAVLVAVGESANGPDGAAHADAWRSTDGGHSWHSARVEVDGFGAHAVMRRAACPTGRSTPSACRPTRAETSGARSRCGRRPTGPTSTSYPGSSSARARPTRRRDLPVC